MSVTIPIRRRSFLFGAGAAGAAFGTGLGAAYTRRRSSPAGRQRIFSTWLFSYLSASLKMNDTSRMMLLIIPYGI
jgi:hypothetical protein